MIDLFLTNHKRFNMSILTFNLSVNDKQNVSAINEPFQIMPTTNNHISEKSLQTYQKANNPNIVCHMNYITHVFSDSAIYNDGTVRYSLRQYVKLAQKLGTNDILIHMPYSKSEWDNLSFGISVINDEICKKGLIVHFEIPAWTKDLQLELNANKDSDPIQYISDYLDEILKYCAELDGGNFAFVFDTAHMFSNGCVKYEQFETLFNKYKQYMKYCHLNGNINPPFKMDNHVPIFDEHNSKIKCWRDISKLVTKLQIICVAEITKLGADWQEWQDYAKQFGFKLVEFNDYYSI